MPALTLIASELVSNSLQHGRGVIVLTLSAEDDQIRLAVQDEGAGPAPFPLEPSRMGGWGLRFVDQLAKCWGTRRDGQGSLVWTETRMARPEGGSDDDDSA